jgi:hypothetical protein
MVRTKTEADAAVDKSLEDRATVLSTRLDKLIDAQYTGSNSVSLDSTDLADETLRAELIDDYEAAGWTVTTTDLGGGTWRITVA